MWFQRRNRNIPLKIVTGADCTHGKSLQQLLTSIKKVEPSTPVDVIDLGLSKEQRDAIENDFGYEVKTFDYSKYPPFFDINKCSGEYAWKAQIVRDAAHDFDGILCWMDAGNLLKEPLVYLRKFTLRHGFYSHKSDGRIKDWTHLGMLSFLFLPPDWKANRKNLNGSCVAFDTRHKFGQELLNQWAAFSLVKECIAPEGSSRENHRQDQALLTVLAYRLGNPHIAEQRYQEFAQHQDID